MTTTEYAVVGMTCAHCERAVVTELRTIPGVEEVAVNLASGTARVTSAEALPLPLVRAAVEEAGYALAEPDRRSLPLSARS